MRWTLVFSVFVLVAAACTGSDGSQSEVVSRTVDVEPEPESPSTTEATTTTERTPTTEALTEDEAEVLEVVRRFFEELPDRPDKTKTPDQYPDVLDEYITDPLLTRIRDGDAQDTAAGVTAESYPSLYFIHTIDISGREARVTTCDLSRDATFAADGELLIASASIFGISDLFLAREDDVWLLEEWLKDPSDETNCDPVTYWGDFDPEGNTTDDPRFDDVGPADEIVAVGQRFAEYIEAATFIDEREGLPSESADGYEAVATRHELYFLRDFLRTQEADTERDTVWAGWTYQIESTHVTGQTAQILMCAAPDLKFLDAVDGSVDESDDRAVWSIAFMHKGEDELWRVEYFWILGDNECEM